MRHLLRPAALKCWALLFTLFLFAPSARADSGPFTGLAGNWSGAGTITLGTGGRESIRCRAQYSVGGDGTSMQQSLRCASDSYRFDLSSDVTSSLGGVITGSWSESSRN